MHAHIYTYIYTSVHTLHTHIYTYSAFVCEYRYAWVQVSHPNIPTLTYEYIHSYIDNS